MIENKYIKNMLDVKLDEQLIDFIYLNLIYRFIYK